MGGGCLWYPRTCRPVGPVLMFLATLPFMLHCLQSPAAVVGKMYPRGNHWAVGHLMGKKSIESVPEMQETSPHNDYLTLPGTAGVTELDQYEHLMQKTLKQIKPPPVIKLLTLGSKWREENRDKYLREMSELLLLAEKLVHSDST